MTKIELFNKKWDLYFFGVILKKKTGFSLYFRGAVPKNGHKFYPNVTILIFFGKFDFQPHYSTDGSYIA